MLDLRCTDASDPAVNPPVPKLRGHKSPDASTVGSQDAGLINQIKFSSMKPRLLNKSCNISTTIVLGGDYITNSGMLKLQFFL